LGDEPGVYADAYYCGLAVQFPVQLFPFLPNINSPANLTFLLEADEVQTFKGYPGHLVEVFAYERLRKRNHWHARLLKSGRLKKNSIKIQLKGILPSPYMSVRVSVDTEVPPGLYDELVLRRLSQLSQTHYGLLGFRVS
jgi:hypothetical protein